MKPKLESAIKGEIMQWLALQKIFAWVNTSTGIYDPTRGCFRKLNGRGQRKGTSDVLGIYKGRPLAIEIKRPGGKPTDDQVRFIEDFKTHGGIAFVATSIEDVIKHLQGVDGEFTQENLARAYALGEIREKSRPAR